MNRILAKRMKENIYYQYDSSQLPEISLADTAVIEPPYIHKRRMPLEYIIYLVRQGEMFLLEDGVRYHLTPGDFLILDPDKIHVGERATHCEYHYIHFHQKSIKKNKMTNEQTTEIILRKRTQSMQSDSCTLSGQERVSLSLLALPKYMHLSDTSSYSEILQKINDGITCQKNRMEGYYNLCACQILEMMILVSRQFVTSLAQEKTGVVGSYRIIYDLLDYLNNCYREPISGVLIEEQLGGNFDYLNRIFRQTTGKTIFQYLTEVRISHAKELLGTTSLKISQVSEKVGFSDESYFSKVFKKMTGMTPMNYMKSR